MEPLTHTSLLIFITLNYKIVKFDQPGNLLIIFKNGFSFLTEYCRQGLEDPWSLVISSPSYRKIY